MAKMLLVERCLDCTCRDDDHSNDRGESWCTISDDQGNIEDVSAIATWCRLPDAPRWIAVSSGELPPPGEEVVRYGVIIWGDERMDIGEMVHRDGTRWADWGVTHWMPKPALPKEECGDGCGNLP